MDAETQILSRLAANHIHLAQFEPLRAILIALRSRSPDVALAILQTIVARAGRLEKVVWSPSCSSPSILTYLSTLELLQFDNASSAWSFDSEALRLRAEFLLLVQSLIDRISDSMQKNIVLEGIEREAEKEVLREKDNIGERVTSLDRVEEELRNGNGKLNECLLVLDKILELGVKRLSVDRVLGVEVNGSGSESRTASLSLIEEGKLVPLNKVIWEYADTFDALCWNIQRQVKGCDQYNSSLAIMVRKDEHAMNQMEDLGEDEDIKVLALIQRSVQQAHLNDLKQCLKEGNVDGAISRICFLHFDYGVEEPEYREVLKELLKVVVLIKEGSGGCWHGMRENLFLIYGEALSSNCMQLVQMIQNIHDDLLSEEVERQRALDNNEIAPPLKCFLSFMADLEFYINVDTKPAALNMAITSCLRDIYHYARVSGLHILECVLNGALSAVNKGQLHEASNVLVLFPRLQPLVAAMGWDLLSGKTTERRQLMQLLWISKSPGSRQEVSSLVSSQIEEISCVEYLCESLCYQLDLASFVACVNSGLSWSSKCSLLLARKEQLVFERDSYSDSFVENFVLERLSVQSPIRVLFDVVPGIKFEDSIELIKMQPISSSVAALKRTQDVELIHMRFALESAVLSLGAMESCLSAEREYHKKVPFFHLNDLRSHLESITSVSRKILMVNVIISLLHMDDFSLSKTHSASPRGSVESPYSSSWEQFDLAEGGNKIVIVFTGSLLDILQCNLPSGVTLDDSMNFGLSMGGKQAIEWRVSIAKRFIEEWQWRLSILQRLLPFSERQWRWKEALTILRAAPSKLLNLCMQRAKYDIGEEAVHRFSLSAEDKATLELADWVDSAFKRPSVEDVVSRAAGTAEGQDIDFSSLRSQLGPLGAILLCIDIAATSTRSAKMSQQLLHQAQVMLSEIYPGVPPKIGHNYWDQIHEVGVISVSRRVLKRMLDFLEQVVLLGYKFLSFINLALRIHLGINAHPERDAGDIIMVIETKRGRKKLSKVGFFGEHKYLDFWSPYLFEGCGSALVQVRKFFCAGTVQDNSSSLQAILSGEVIISSTKDLQRKGQRDRAIAMLHQMIEDAHIGKRQFLSGKLHNLARAVADEEADTHFLKGEESQATDRTVLSNVDTDGLLGLGFKVDTKVMLSTTAGETSMSSAIYDVKDSGKRIFGPLSIKPTTYLSRFILHIAAIGDIVDGTDSTHDFNFFSLVYEWPKDLLTQLVFDRGSTDAASKVAEIMCADFVHEVISACVPPVYPPRFGPGWACIPVIPICSTGGSDIKVLSPSSKEAKQNCYIRSSATPGVPLYPLQLDVVKHLVKISPVRSVLACVFGSSILYSGSNSSVSSSLNDGLLQAPDADQLFYELALDQSERFPTLNRWIQMQTNRHRVSEFAVATKPDAGDSDKGESKASIKRLRDFDSDTESEIDDMVGNNSISTTFPVLTGQDSATQDPSKGWSRPEVSKRDNTAFLSFDWENEEPYEKAVERLIDDGKLMDALALSDRFLRNGASDQLLHLLIVCEEARDSISEESRDYGCQSISCNSWQYCLRLKDKQLAATLALKYMHKWELDASLDVLTMCACHLPHNDPIRNEVVQVKQALQKYSRILSADDHYKNWQEVEAVFKEDPEGLALRLAGKGAVSAALEVAESAELSIDLRRELQGRQLVKLLTADPLDGGGPAEASRFLSSLRDSDDALPVAVGAMQLLPNLRSKQLLVHFFLKRRDGNLSDVEVSRLNSWALGLRVLAALPLPWQQRCSSLHEHPHLIMEVLLMRKQLHSASVILKEFPSLRDNNTIFTYAAKAIAVSVSSPPREHRVSVSGNRPKQKMRAGASSRSSFSSSFSNLQKEARRALSWTPRNAGDKAAPKDTYKKRKSSGLTPSERVAWEAMTGIQEDRVLVYSADGQERISSISIAEEWMLTGDAMKDDSVRGSHRYESAPDVTLFKALLSLCTDELASAKSAMDLCISQMKNILNSQLLPENASMEIIGRAYYATETFVQGLLYAKSLLRKLVSGSDLSSNSEKSRDADDASSDAGSSNVGSQSDELSEVLSQADKWLGRAELLQSLLGSGIAASLDDIADVDSSAHLRDRLIMEERYSMAVYTSKKCKIDVFPVWNAWGHALIRIEHYAQARVKFKQAFQLYKGDLMPVIQEIINTIEGGPQVDVSAVRSMYEHLAKSAPTILDDSLSADAYLNVLHMPSTFPRSERSRRSQQSANTNSIYGSDFDDGPRSNLDSIRYVECVNYLQEYARQLLLGFMFRHGHYKDACMLFFPSDAIPSPQPSSVGAVTSSLSPQRVDPLATDYGTIDDLCELCVSNGAMDVLEEVLSTRMSSSKPQDVAVNQYIATALGRICTFCENYKHFNYLYRFQVIKKDHVGAGLCCIQLFMNSISQEEAIKHLEHAKMHFDEGLSVRNKGGDYTKLVTKTIRGKSASEKLSEEGLVKFSARVSIQIEVVKSFNDSEGPQWKHSVFGNPNDPETFRRRCKIAETLVEKNFDLAFRVIYQFDLPAVDIYAAVAASLAERKKGGQLTEFFRNIKGTIEDEDWDQVLGAAISVYANKHKERPDRLIDMLKSSHRKVLACVVCGRLKSAFQLAAQSGSVADVQYVAHQALHANALPVLDMCKQWLAKYM